MYKTRPLEAYLGREAQALCSYGTSFLQRVMEKTFRQFNTVD